MSNNFQWSLASRLVMPATAAILTFVTIVLCQPGWWPSLLLVSPSWNFLCYLKTNVFETAYVLCINYILFVWFDSLRPINNLSVKQGGVFLGWTSTKLGKLCLAQGSQHSDDDETRTNSLTASRSRVKHSTTEPLRSHIIICMWTWNIQIKATFNIIGPYSKTCLSFH